MAPESPEKVIRNGTIAALLAYGLWGFMPIYFKLVQTVPPLEVLAHRVLWAVPFGLAILVWRGQLKETWQALITPRTVGMLALSAVFIAVNWGVYIWAVQQNQIFQASLGYYINPLLYVVVGVAFFGERLRRLQLWALILAAAGVIVLTFSGDQIPVLALALATSFTIYGVIRKQVAVGGMPGLFVETLILLPIAGSYLALLAYAGNLHFGAQYELGFNALVMLAGPVTVVPLLFFALAARRLPLSTLGFMQFIAPTVQFLTGVAYGEPLSTPALICFTLIWGGVIAYAVDAWQQGRSRPATVT